MPWTNGYAAQGILDYKRKHRRAHLDRSFQRFLDRFYMSRIGIRMLIGQHISLVQDPPRQDYVGVICTATNVRAIAQEAIDNAQMICQDYYALFEPPQVQLICPEDVHFMYVESHLAHMLFETVKNSLRAVVEFHGAESEAFPPIKVIVSQGQHDITIKISDEGGGIPRNAMDMVWTYMYTTAEERDLSETIASSDFKAPMAVSRAIHGVIGRAD